MNFFTARGGRGNEGTVQIDGMNVGSAFNGGGVAGFGYDTANADGNPGHDRRRPRRNRSRRPGVQHDSRAPVATTSAAPTSSATPANGRRANNLDDELRSFGITEVPGLIKNWDTNFAMGGPIKRDRLWFFGNVRSFGSYDRRARALWQRERRQPERV